MAVNQAETGGYDCNWVKEPPDDLICLICLLVARDPQQHGGINGCGRIFCTSCIKAIATCPNCRETEPTLFQDKKTARHINTLEVRCDNLRNGCEWQGGLKDKRIHINMCDYTFLPCPNQCHDENGQITEILREDLQEHLEYTCPRRQYNCPHCQESGEYHERTTTHIEVCPLKEILCPNNPNSCTNLIPRCEITAHRSVCEYEPVSCKYAEVGCTDKPIRKDLLQHEQDDQLHLRLTTAQVLKLTTKIANLEIELTDHKQKIHAQLAGQQAIFDKQLAKLETELTGQKKNLERQRADFEAKLRDQNKEFKKQTADLSARMTYMENKPQLICKCDDFQRRKIEEEDFSSCSFYSSAQGYKFHLSISPNGDNDGEGTHISVYACLMRGDYDDSLTWPFLGTVKFELLNQLEDKNHATHTIKFIDNECSKRPFFVKENPGWGNLRFVRHDKLRFNRHMNQQFLKDDTLFFRVTVQPPCKKPWLQCT